MVLAANPCRERVRSLKFQPPVEQKGSRNLGKRDAYLIIFPYVHKRFMIRAIARLSDSVGSMML